MRYGEMQMPKMHQASINHLIFEVVHEIARNVRPGQPKRIVKNGMWEEARTQLPVQL